jgi:pheromone a factor receptor
MISNPVFQPFALIGIILCLIPLPWHLEAWNTGTCLYMIWTALGLINSFANSIIWNHTAINLAPHWCDFSVRIGIAVQVAIPACSLCINRRLYHIASIRTVTVSRSEKRRAILVDLAIGLGIPLLAIPCQYVVEGHRFDIYEGIGCLSETYFTPLAIPLWAALPLIIGCVSLVYSVLSIRAFLERRKQFNELLSGSNNLNSSRYLRLMILASMEILFTVPISAFFLHLNVAHGLRPWKGWADTHSNFSRVIEYPAIIWTNLPYLLTAFELYRWLLVFCAFLFFGFFGFADEARKNYRRAFDSVAKSVGISTTSSGLTSTFGGSGSVKDIKIMSYSDPDVNLSAIPDLEKLGKRSSFESFDAKVTFKDVGGFLTSPNEEFSPTSTTSGTSTAAASLPPSKGDNYSFKSSDLDLSYPEPSVNRSSVSPHTDDPEMTRSESRAGSIDSV